MPMENEPERIGRYSLIRSLGKGGMGEVFLAFDESCGRQVALKRIRTDLKENPTIKNRFLREARLAAQLSHPNIIAIHAIEQEGDLSFYTMPFIEGETLRAILKRVRLEGATGVGAYSHRTSLSDLVRIFLSVCQAIAYCHSKGILHRDLKPENILVGKFGETMIVDWGLAQYANSENEEETENETEETPGDYTRPGKVVGTLAYMAPERALHHPATFSSDLYSLGAILYQILTLRMPFRRPTMKAFRANMNKEQLVDPIEAAPYRDIPPQLAEAASRCLSFDKLNRYTDVKELITEIERYAKGLPEWMPAAVLDVHQKQDWEFQEYVAWTEPFAVTRSEGAFEWVWMMVSKTSLLGNFKIEAKITQEEKSRGLHILFAIPEKKRLSRLEEGWTLWVGSPEHPGCTLSRARIGVLTLPDVYLEPGKPHVIRIEKVGEKLDCFLDNTLLFHYQSPLPIIGSHIGLMAHDNLFSIESLSLFSGSYNATINCLAVPDAFLERAEYAHAWGEYRKIAFCFKGRHEGSEALFRAGLTLLEQSLDQKSLREKKKLQQEAFDEFDRLRKTPAAPLEYLGKSLVYRASQDIEEETKCLELGLRKYKSHPLVSLLREQILYRMHEACHKNRTDAYSLTLLALTQIPALTEAPEHRALLQRLRDDLEPVPFFVPTQDSSDIDLSIQLAFWLSHERVLDEIGEQNLDPVVESNWWFASLELDYSVPKPREPWQIVVKKSQTDLNLAIALFNKNQEENPRLLRHLLRKCFDQLCLNKSVTLLETSSTTPYLERAQIFLYLLRQEWEKALLLFNRYSPEALRQETHHFFVPYGCYLSHTQGIEATLHHFSDLSHTLYPSTSILLGHYLHGRSPEKIAPFHWQRKELVRQLILFYSCAGHLERVNNLAKQLSRSRVNLHPYTQSRE